MICQNISAHYKMITKSFNHGGSAAKYCIQKNERILAFLVSIGPFTTHAFRYTEYPLPRFNNSNF